ncbi:MAG: hypothetical protein AVDCRST_MAG05-728, partial [uncultured Rubrobacteraceae bacterium]
GDGGRPGRSIGRPLRSSRPPLGRTSLRPCRWPVDESRRLRGGPGGARLVRRPGKFCI